MCNFLGGCDCVESLKGKISVVLDNYLISEGIFICVIWECTEKPLVSCDQLLLFSGTAPGGRLKGRGSPPSKGCGDWGRLWPPCCRLCPPPLLGLGDCCGLLPNPELPLLPDPELKFSSPGGGALVVGTSQSSVGGVTHLLLFLSKTSMAGQRWRRGYPPWHAQYLLQDLPRGTLPLASSLQSAENSEEWAMMHTWFQSLLTMLLTAGYVLWPVARVCLLVVEQPPDAELLRGRPIPACPVASTGGLVAEYSVQPVTVLRTLGRVWRRKMSENIL